MTSCVHAVCCTVTQNQGRARSVTPFLYQNISVVTRLLHWGLFSTAIMDSTVTFFEGWGLSRISRGAQKAVLSAFLKLFSEKNAPASFVWWELCWGGLQRPHSAVPLSCQKYMGTISESTVEVFRPQKQHIHQLMKRTKANGRNQRHIWVDNNSLRSFNMLNIILR